MNDATLISLYYITQISNNKQETVTGLNNFVLTMNISQLFHNDKQIQFIPHYSVYSMNPNNKVWYFYSAKGCTLRKKIQNTSISTFLNSTTSEHSDPSKHIQHINNNNDKQMILQLRQVDYRQPKDSQLYTIACKKYKLHQLTHSKDKKLTEQQMIKHNNWNMHTQSPYSQISLYKIQESSQFYSLLFSQNIVKCRAPITTYMKNRLTSYCQSIQSKVQNNLRKLIENNKQCNQDFESLQNITDMKIKQFQLVFTYIRKQGKLRVLFAHNFIISCQITSNQSIGEGKHAFKTITMYKTDFKVANDQYEQIQLIVQQQCAKIAHRNKNVGKPIIFSDQQAIRQDKSKKTKQHEQQDQQKALLNQLLNPILYEQKNLQFNQKQEKTRLNWLRQIKKLPTQPQLQAHTKSLHIGLKKQQIKQKSQQFQCQACRNYIVTDNQNENKKLVTNNRIKQIQILRQVKIKHKKTVKKRVGEYELVPVCQLCYRKFIEIVNINNHNHEAMSMNNKQNSTNRINRISNNNTKQNKEMQSQKQQGQKVFKNGKFRDISLRNIQTSKRSQLGKNQVRINDTNQKISIKQQLCQKNKHKHKFPYFISKYHQPSLNSAKTRANSCYQNKKNEISNNYMSNKNRIHIKKECQTLTRQSLITPTIQFTQKQKEYQKLQILLEDRQSYDITRCPSKSTKINYNKQNINQLMSNNTIFDSNNQKDEQLQTDDDQLGIALKQYESYNQKGINYGIMQNNMSKNTINLKMREKKYNKIRNAINQL